MNGNFSGGEEINRGALYLAEKDFFSLPLVNLVEVKLVVLTYVGLREQNHRILVEMFGSNRCNTGYDSCCEIKPIITVVEKPSTASWPLERAPAGPMAPAES